MKVCLDCGKVLEEETKACPRCFTSNFKTRAEIVKQITTKNTEVPDVSTPFEALEDAISKASEPASETTSNQAHTPATPRKSTRSGGRSRHVRDNASKAVEPTSADTLEDTAEETE